MKQRWYQFLCLLLLVTIIAVPVVFAANGKIVGTVRDAATKDVVPGANVLVVGTTLGGAADAQGRYYILNVPPGTYSLQASAVGFGKLKIERITVSLDQTLEMNINLQGEAVQLGEMVISAERKVVDKNQTSTKTTVTSEELQSIPTVSALEILNTTPGAYKGFVRGGKINETKTIVEGVDVSDQLYSVSAEQTNLGILQASVKLTRNESSKLSSQSTVNFSAVEQFSLTTGATGAENASATAGTINYALKEGSGSINGSVQARVSQFNGLTYNGPNVYAADVIYFNDKTSTNGRLKAYRQQRDSLIGLSRVVPTALINNIFADSTRSGKYVYTPGRYNNQEKPLMDIEASIGGNVTDEWRFFLTGRYFDSHGRFPNERNREADMTLKTSYALTNAIKLNVFGIVNDRGKLFGWKNTAYNDFGRYFLEGIPKNDGLDYVASAKVTHVLSPSTFYEVQVSQTYRNNRYGYTDENGDGYCDLNEGGDFIAMDNAADVAKYISSPADGTTNPYYLGKFFRVGNEASQSQLPPPFGVGNVQVDFTRPQFYYENTVAIARTVRGDITSQVDFHNQLKAGFSFRFHEISKIERNSSLGADASDARLRLLVENWKFYPTELSGYLSDRMEYGGLVINLGLRVDRYDPHAKDYANYYNLFVPDTVLVDGGRYRENLPYRGGNDIDAKWFFSPRVGVSHPISENAAMFFSYSRQAIPPPFARLYSAYNIVFGAPGSFPNFQSLNQDLTKSSNYELGVQWEFMPARFGLNFTAYMRDVENYSPAAVTLQLAAGQNVLWFTGQYADSRGVEVSLQALKQSYFDFLSVNGRVSYAYTYVKASGWVGNDAAQQTLFTAADSLKFGNTLPFGNFQYYNKVQNNVTGSSSTLTGGYDRTHRISYVLVLGLPEDIQLSSIGTFQSGFYYPITNANVVSDARVLGRELGTSPWNKMVDFRLEKGFRFDNLRFAIFAEVKNAFNWVNIIGYDNTVSGTDLWQISNKAGSPDPTGIHQRSIGPDGSWFYDIPREFYFGARLDF
jgi:hypothetical protein